MNSTLNVLCCVERSTDGLSKIKDTFHLYQLVKPCFTANSTHMTAVRFILKVYWERNATELKHICQGMTIRSKQTECNSETSAGNIAYVFFWIMLLLVTIAGNAAVCWVVTRISYLRKSYTNLFLASLAVSDMCVGLFVIPVKTDFTLHNQHFCAGQIMCRLYFTIDNFAFTASITNLLIISLDRYFAISWPYRYNAFMTSRRTKYIIMAVWMYSALWAGLANIKWRSSADTGILLTDNLICQARNPYFSTILFIVVFCIPLVIMGLVYVKILGIALRHAKSMANNHLASDMANLGSVGKPESKYMKARYKRKLELRTVQTIVVVYGTFLVCWLPVTLLSVTSSWCRSCFQTVNTFWTYIIFVEILPIMNSCMNPFIYALMNSQFRRAFKDLLRQLHILKLGKANARYSSTKKSDYHLKNGLRNTPL